MTNEAFRAAVANYLAANSLSQSGLARRLQVNRKTVRGWLHSGVLSEKRREVTCRLYPQIFSADSAPSDSPDTETAGRCPSRPWRVALKTEFARQYIAALSVLLSWFLFEATGEERDGFRDELGEAWKEFLELTRGMTGENAFQIAKQEGRLKHDNS